VGVLQRFERKLEGLVQGAFTRAFGGWVEPVEVAAALTREAEDKKAIVAAGRVLVPNAYVVELGRSDADRLHEYDEPLRQELATMVRETAQEQGWSFVGPVEVRFEEVPDLGTGAFRIRSAAVPGQVEAAPHAPHEAAPHQEPAAGHVRTVAAPPAGFLDGPHGRYVLRARTVVGRGEDNDLVLADTGVSRRHAELLTSAEGTLVRDLGSTNGTWVNGVRVHEQLLDDGDRLTVGTTQLVFRSEG
jgi:hypothetical protein